jgi:hypothetical protein
MCSVGVVIDYVTQEAVDERKSDDLCCRILQAYALGTADSFPKSSRVLPNRSPCLQLDG